MQSTFLKEDVTILLKDISGLVLPMSTPEREKLIQSGVHYCEMLPIEYTPSEKYISLYEDALDNFSDITAGAVSSVSEKIYENKGRDVVLISLARAGIPVGILIKRRIEKKYRVTVPHYAISIIRGRGIDHNAMKYILERHNPFAIQFIDGWTGKGAILNELRKEVKQYGLDDSLAVLADPANVADISGTNDDFLIASSCLNSTVCGLISRTFHKHGIIGQHEFHGAAFFDDLREQDRTYQFINKIESCIKDVKETRIKPITTGTEEVFKIAKAFGIRDINLIKPGIGETTRVLLRRVPDVVLINPDADEKYISHILMLAEEKHLRTMNFPLKRYKACGIIRNVSDA